MTVLIYGEAKELPTFLAREFVEANKVFSQLGFNREPCFLPKLTSCGQFLISKEICLKYAKTIGLFIIFSLVTDFSTENYRVPARLRSLWYLHFRQNALTPNTPIFIKSQTCV